jgi:hypothetical protein
MEFTLTFVCRSMWQWRWNSPAILIELFKTLTAIIAFAVQVVCNTFALCFWRHFQFRAMTLKDDLDVFRQLLLEQSRAIIMPEMSPVFRNSLRDTYTRRRSYYRALRWWSALTADCHRRKHESLQGLYTGKAVSIDFKCKKFTCKQAVYIQDSTCKFGRYDDFDVDILHRMFPWTKPILCKRRIPIHTLKFQAEPRGLVHGSTIWRNFKYKYRKNRNLGNTIDLHVSTLPDWVQLNDDGDVMFVRSVQSAELCTLLCKLDKSSELYMFRSIESIY